MGAVRYERSRRAQRAPDGGRPRREPGVDGRQLSRHRRRSNDPTLRTDLGEALAAIPEHHGEAARILGEQADKG